MVRAFFLLPLRRNTRSLGSAFVDGLIWATGGGNNTGGSSGTQFNQVYRQRCR
jgi:hypothetical protein